MTTDELRALDVQVHQEVMGRTCVPYTPTGGEFGSDLNGWYDYPQTTILPQPVPRYSTDIAAAWRVVEQMRKELPACYIEIIAMTGKRGEVKHSARVANMDDDFTFNGAHMYDASPPVAICKAALKAFAPKVATT